MNFEILEANENDLDEVVKLNLKIFDNMINKDWYSIDSFVKEIIIELLEDKGTIIKTVDKDTNEIIAFLTIARYPDKDLMTEIKLNEGFTNYIEMENSVVKEEYRGNKLEYKMLLEGEKIMRKRFPKIIGAYATVHPNNIASLHSLEKAEYKIIKETKMYEGKDRYIVFKKFD